MTQSQIPPAFVLVRPQMGENIGAAARAMLNFGLERMRVVSPRDGWPSPQAVALASGAGRVLDGAQIYDTVQGAVADCEYVYATTARGRELTKPVFTPEAAMQDARTRIGAGQRVAVLFGPERAGLENDDITRANAIITVPVNPDFPSLNLAQCVLLLGYEWRRQNASAPEVVYHMARTQWANGAEVEALGDHFESRLSDAGFFYPPEKVEGMKEGLRNMWTRLNLTQAEVQTLHGMLRQIAYKLRQQDRGE
jgi:tRNA/rRNA methyltransferase